MDESVGAVVVGRPPVPPGVRVLATVAASELPATVVRLKPRMVMLDLDATGRDAGVVAISTLTDRAPGVPVLASSSGTDHALVLDAVRAGAAGYAAGADPWTIADLVAAVIEGRPAFSPGLAGMVLDAVANPVATAPPLSPRESDVLRLIVEGLTARQIAGRLVLSPRTVENHVQRLLRKLDVPGRGALVRYAIEHGLA